MVDPYVDGDISGLALVDLYEDGDNIDSYENGDTNSLSLVDSYEDGHNNSFALIGPY